MKFLWAPDFGKRSELLDCLRAVAVIMVIVFHVTRELHIRLDAVAFWFARYGFLGVDIFYPLSGFLITGFLLTHSGNQAIGTFFLRRFFRIVPLYFLAIGLYYVGSRITGIDTDLLDRLWVNLSFLTGWLVFLDGRETVPYTITWSLSVEEFAYILFGLGAWLMRRNFVALLWIVTAFSIGLRFWLNTQDAVDIYYFPPARLDSIAIGGLVAVAMRRNVQVIPLLAVALVAAYALSPLDPDMRKTLLYVKLTLITCILIVASQKYLPRFRSRLTRPLAIIGFYSYFMYLTHYFFIMGLLMAFRWVGTRPEFWSFSLIVVALTAAAGYLSFAIFEGPMMAFGRRLEPDREGRETPIVHPAPRLTDRGGASGR